MLRFIVCLLAALACLFAYTCRLNLSTVVVFMFDDIQHSQQNPTTTTPMTTTVSPPVTAITTFNKTTHESTTIDDDEFPTETPLHAQLLDNCLNAGKNLYYPSSEEDSMSILMKWKYSKQSTLDSCDSNFRQTSVSSTLARHLSTQANADIRDIIIRDEDQQDQIKIDSSSKIRWFKDQQEDIKGAFFWGYVVSQVPGAIIAERYGAKVVLLACGLGSGLCSLAFPYFARLSYHLAFVIRVIMGLVQGSLFPAVYILFSQWLPDSERPKYLAFPSAFSRVGQIIMNLLITPLVKSFGWESVFYFWGGLTVIWCLLWFLFVSSSPSDSRLISKAEKTYIEEGMKTKCLHTNPEKTIITASTFVINQTQKELSRSAPVDWFKLVLRTKSVWLLALVMFASEWSNYILIINLTTFLSVVIKIEKETIMIINSLLFAIFSVMYPASGYVAAKIAESNTGLSKLGIRKLFEVLACTIQACCCLKMALGCDDKMISTIVFFVMMFGRSLVGGGQCLIPPEISKEHSGTIFAFANTLANLACAAGPKILKTFLDGQDEKAASSYITFWYFSAFIFITSGILFYFLADSKSHNFRHDGNHFKSLSLAHISNEKSTIHMIGIKSFPITALPVEAKAPLNNFN